MSKTLFIIRHAKSSWDYPELDDFHRPLNKRGLRDAPRMAQRFAESFGTADLWLTSPAIRALSTAVFHASACEHSYDRIRLDPHIYAAEFPTLVEVIREIPSHFNSVAIFGHNPGLSDLVRVLTGEAIEDLSTLGTARLALPFDWAEISPQTAELIEVTTPKVTLV